ncbi:MAG: DUF2085 domain-containing protein [Sandaracinaceae bacterium]
MIAFAAGLFAFFASVPVLFPESPFAGPTRQLFGAMCHQIEARSFVWRGETMPVCHRCTGIYVGIPLGALAALALAPDPTRLRNWVLLLVPMVLQVVIAWAWDASDLWYLRVLTGAMAGGGAGLLLARLLGSATPPPARL